MPLHISEIGVHMAVRGPGGGPSSEGAGASPPRPAPLTALQRDAIVQECVTNVLRRLRMDEAR